MLANQSAVITWLGSIGNGTLLIGPAYRFQDAEDNYREFFSFLIAWIVAPECHVA